MLNIRFFGLGTLRTASGKLVTVRARKEMAVLAYLLVERSQPHSRDSLQALFWQDFATESARNNLRVVLAHLQALLPAGQPTHRLLITNRNEVEVNPESDLWVDASEFQRLIETTQRHDHTSRSTCAECQQSLLSAVDLYRGEFLAGLALGDCPAFEEWLFLQRERQHLLMLQALHDLTIYTETNGKLESALGFALRQVELDPLRESAYRQQMQILAAQGERSSALAAFERCQTIINSELGVDVEPDTLALYHQILSLKIKPKAAQPSVLQPPRTQETSSPPTNHENSSPRHNLPQQLTPFVGREQEIAQLQQRLVDPTYRLLSIIGPGGIGKSRLAIQVAAANQHLFVNGVFFVPLAGVQQVAAIPSAIIAVLNATLGAGAASPIQQLLQLLAHQKMLLVIDNFEHLLDGVDLLLSILQAAPNVRLLVTTREQLNCQAEDRFTLDGLATPAQVDLAQVDLADAGHYAAVRLFCERAYRLNKRFKLTAENCAAVVRICQLVEGMPLALELAATWIEDFDCADLAAAIAQNQSMLATTQRDLPARHRSMQAVFDYSWQMLSSREQHILSQLALCHGQFSAQIGIQLTGASLIDLTGLRHKSLLRITEAGYYDLHPLIRTFALATLTDEAIAQVEAHLATLYAQRVADQEHTLYSVTAREALRAIERELENIHQAWRWAEAHARTDLLLQSVDVLGEFYTVSGRVVECETSFLPLVQRLLAHQPAPNDTRVELSLHLLDKICRPLDLQSKYADALLWGLRLVELAQMVSNREYEARGLYHCGYALNDNGKKVAARQKLEEALLIARQVEQPRLLGSILLELGLTYLEESGGHVATYLQEALTVQRSLGNRSAEQRILLFLGVNCTQMEEYQAGRAYQLEALNLLNVTGNRPLEMRIVGGLGFTLSTLGDYSAALEYLASARRISKEIQWRVQESFALHNLCCLQRKLGNLDLAVEHGIESLRIALQQDSEDAANFARIHLGYALLARGELAHAAQTFQEAQDSWHAGGRPTLAREATVGLAAVRFHQGNLTEATTLIAPFVPILLEQVPQAEERYEMVLTAHAILTATGDTRTHRLLTTAYAQLQQSASKLTDSHLLHCFWQVPAHRKIRELSSQL